MQLAMLAESVAGRAGAALALGAATLALGAMQEAAPPIPFGPPPATSTALGPVPDETYAWRPVAIGAGGFITGMATDARGETRVVRTDVHGAYLWDAGADRWRQLVNAAAMPAEDRQQDAMNEGAYEVTVAPGDPNRLYLAIKGRVYRSVDRGMHWQRPPEQPPFPATFTPNGPFRFHGPFLAVSPRNADLVLLGTPEAGLWRSRDGGVRWSRVADVPASKDLRPAPGIQAPGTVVWFAPAGQIWAMAAGSGMFVSDDDGEHFHPLPSSGAEQPTGLAHGIFTPDGSFFGVDPESKKLWRYRSGSWSDLTRTAELSPRAYQAIARIPGDGNLYLFDNGGRVLRSTNNGDAWWPLRRVSTAGGGDPPWLRLSNQSFFATADVQADPVAPGRLWAAAGTGVYRADAASLSLNWTSESRGIEELVANDVVQPPGGAPLFAAWDFGIHLKPDLDAFSTSYGPRERVLIAAQQVAWTPADPHFLVTNASDTRMGCCSEDGQSVLAGYSEDGGRNWHRFASLPTPPGTKPDDPWRMAFGTIAISANDTANIVWEPSFNRSPFYTRDRGKTWERVVLPGEQLPFTGSHQAYHLARKTLAADRVLPDTFYLVHSGEGANAALAGLWRTSDGGAHWDRVFRGEIAPMSRFAAKLRVVPGHAGHLFFTSAVSGNVDTRLRRSTDGGAHWSVLDAVDHVDDVAFGRPATGSGYPTIFVSGRVNGVYGIWRSVDDTKSWQRLAAFPAGRLDQVSVMEGDKDVFGRVYIGYVGSGWLYGAPATCAVAPYRAGDDRECVRVE